MTTVIRGYKVRAMVIICLLFIGNGFTSDAQAQNPAEELLRQKTENRLSKIIEQSPSIMGLAAVDLTSNERVEKLSEILYDYFWRMGNATRYGVFRDPVLMNK